MNIKIKKRNNDHKTTEIVLKKYESTHLRDLYLENELLKLRSNPSIEEKFSDVINGNYLFYNTANHDEIAIHKTDIDE